ncbi:cofactor-independent phosphoglycerate mutase [bacterium]|nr:cofactor-independent phosphoglycerate mutase [bacterium]
MKSIILLGDGMADGPVAELGNQTPLAAARKPAMDRIAREGRSGLFRTLEPGMSSGSAAANLSVLGYDPRVLFPNGDGRSVLEAASLGIELAAEDLALRVNLITIEDGKIRSHSSGHISSAESRILIEALALRFRDRGIRLVPGLSYRHLLVVPGGNPALSCTPPHDHLGSAFEPLLVRPESPEAKPTADLLNGLIRDSQPLLDSHEVNRERTATGKLPANSIWPWSPGIKPQIQTLQERFRISSGAVICAVDLIKGIGKYAGLEVKDVPGATGGYDTDYEAKADACLEAIRSHDLVYVHVEAPDEAGHEKNAVLKKKCIEDLDSRLVARILDGLGDSIRDTRIALLTDHPTPVATGAHGRDPVPVSIMGPGFEPDGIDRYDESSASRGQLGMLAGDAFIKLILNV